MKNKQKIYIITMYRWGDREKHSYVGGVFTKKQKAIDISKQLQEERGNKYIPEVLEMDINEDHGNSEIKVIVALKPHPEMKSNDQQRLEKCNITKDEHHGKNH